MTENSPDSPWQSPAGNPPPAPQPAFGGFVSPTTPPPAAPPVYGQPAYGQPGPTNGQPTAGQPGPPPGAWAPPPRPGLIPLRPLGLGDILGGSFKVLRRNPRPVIGVSLLIKGIVAIVTIASLGLFTVLGVATAINAVSPDAASVGLGAAAQTQAASLVSLILGIVADAILQGIITLEVARGTLGEKLPLRALWQRARGRILVLVGWSLLIGAVLLVAFILVFALLVLLIVSGGAGGIAAAIGLAVLFGLAALVLSFWLGTRLSLVPSVLVLERARLGEAIRRSWSLTRGYFWRTLGIELLVALIVGAAAGIILTPITLAITLITLSSSTSVTGATIAPQTSFLTTVITEIASAIIGAITAIISTSADSLIYIDLRIRKEGLDLELLRFVDAKDSGADVPDPYLSRNTVPPPFDSTGMPWA